jgi:hypothetical protein
VVERETIAGIAERELYPMGMKKLSSRWEGRESSSNIHA